MSLGDHLEELRKRLILGLIGPVIFAVGLMFIGTHLVAFLCRPLLRAMKAVNEQPQLVMPQVGDAFGIYLRVSLIGGLILGIPWLLYQMWMFVAPGLYPHERRFVRGLMPGSAVLSVAGVVFMYYVMLPFTLWFLVGFASYFPMPELGQTLFETLMREQPELRLPEPGQATPLQIPVLAEDPAEPVEGQVWLNSTQMDIRVHLNGRVRKFQMAGLYLVTPQLHIREYISFVMWMALAFAVAFQLPLVMLGLGVTGLVGYAGMASARKYAVLGCFVIGAVLTPADPFSMLALAIPMYALYELGLLLVRWFVGRSPEEA